MTNLRRSVLPTAAAALLLAACAQLATRRLEPIEPPPFAATEPVAFAGLHNVVRYGDDMICGGVPEGEEGMATLAAMGIKTVISVDGQLPDVEAAERHGLHYVHLPISYDAVPAEREKQLAQALASLPHPIYMHCHHGKHRSAAALGAAMIGAGMIDTDTALARMKVSGTGKDYQGLWQSVRDAKPVPQDQLHVDPAVFPKLTKVSGMVMTMNEIDSVMDLVKAAQKAAWQVPADHPDLVPAKEAARMHALFAALQLDPESKKLDATYQDLLAKTLVTTQALDDAVRAMDRAAADAAFAQLGKDCKACHKDYRDR